MHPKTLPSHETKIYLNSAIFKDNEEFDYVRSYYHNKAMGFPIYMHRHNFYEINIIYKGSGYHYIKGQCYEAKEGSVFIIPPDIIHGYYTENEDTFIILHILIHPLFMERYKKELNSMRGFSILFEIEPKLREKNKNEFFLTLLPSQINDIQFLIDKLVCDNESFNETEKIDRIGALLSIISYLTDSLVKKNQMIMDNAIKANVLDSTFIIKTMDYINSNYYEKITIDKLASMANMSRASYIRHFEALNGKTLNQYLTKIRIKNASDLLLNTNLTITEISMRCGFFDSSHFSKIFKKYKGKLPLQYRDENKDALKINN